MVPLFPPLGLIGVASALLAPRSSLGFVMILGILSLLGMAATRVVILIVQNELDRATGLAPSAAAA